jgi:hypothetical protein
LKVKEAVTLIGLFGVVAILTADDADLFIAVSRG